MIGLRVIVACAALVLAAACLPSPQRAQSADLLDKLIGAHANLRVGTPDSDQSACEAVGDTETRLMGEPGLSAVQPAWSSLTRAAEALHAACGLTTLLAYPTAEPPSATQSWQAGVQRELNVACEHLRAAAEALARDKPC